MNFVLPESLGGGGIASLRSDPQVMNNACKDIREVSTTMQFNM